MIPKPMLKSQGKRSSFGNLLFQRQYVLKSILDFHNLQQDH